MNKTVGFLAIDDKDNVGTLLGAAAAGDELAGVGRAGRPGKPGRPLVARDDIPQGHKVALTTIQTGFPVLKYGVAIGLATSEIHPGEWVHVHNLRSARGKGAGHQPTPEREAGR